MDMMEIVLNVAKENNAKKVNEIAISIGLLAHASPVQLEFCLKSIAEGTIAQDAKYVFKEAACDAKCSCGYEKRITGISEISDGEALSSSYDALIYLSTLSCPECDSRIVLEEADKLFVDSIDID